MISLSTISNDRGTRSGSHSAQYDSHARTHTHTNTHNLWQSLSVVDLQNCYVTRSCVCARMCVCKCVLVLSLSLAALSIPPHTHTHTHTHIVTLIEGICFTTLLHSHTWFYTESWALSLLRQTLSNSNFEETPQPPPPALLYEYLKSSLTATNALTVP
jgi:hypothetical protein